MLSTRVQKHKKVSCSRTKFLSKDSVLVFTKIYKVLWSLGLNEQEISVEVCPGLPHPTDYYSAMNTHQCLVLS